MNSVSKIFSASTNIHVKAIGLVCVLLTACGGQDSTNPRALDTNPPQISIKTNPDTENSVNIGRYDSQHPLLSQYPSYELIIQTVDDLIVYDDDGIDDKGNEIDGVVIGFRKPVDFSNTDYIPETVNLHQIGMPYTDAGATAQDVWDIDNLVDQDTSTTETDAVITLNLLALETNLAHTHSIEYNSKDTSGNIGEAYRNVIIGDYIAPVVTLYDSDTVTVEANETFNDPSAYAIDESDNEAKLVTRTLVLCEDVLNGVCLNPTSKEEVITASPATYIATYSATDAAGNEGTATRSIIVLGAFTKQVDVIKNGEIDALWDKGIYAFDETNDWAAVNDPVNAESIDWKKVNDSDRGYEVLEITHADTDKGAGIYIETSTPVNLLGAKEGGILQFDIKVVSGDPSITIKSGCGFPCGGGPRDLGPKSTDGKWETVRYPVSLLEAGGNDGSNGHDFTKVTTGIEVWATKQRGTVFRIDNVLWRCLTNCSKEKFDPRDDFTDWVKTGIADGYTISEQDAPTAYDGYDLVWQDEFDTNAVDTAKWKFDLGNGAEEGNVGWGNSELQYYRPENATVADSLLTIEAQYHHEALAKVNGKDVPGGATYTSAKLITRDILEFQYGRVDIRAVVAEGQGLWSAGWMLGATGRGWPWSGEIDIVDTIGGVGQEDMIVHNMYWNTTGPDDPSPNYKKASLSQSNKGETYLDNTIPGFEQGDTYSNKFHVYSIVWTEENISFYVNNYKTLDVPMIGDMGESFKQGPFYLILNVAVGGQWPGNPQLEDPTADDFTQFERGMLVDYVRVYQPTTP
jgi:beta-glucanase (GH16 family)